MTIKAKASQFQAPRGFYYFNVALSIVLLDKYLDWCCLLRECVAVQLVDEVTSHNLAGENSRGSYLLSRRGTIIAIPGKSLAPFTYSRSRLLHEFSLSRHQQPDNRHKMPRNSHGRPSTPNLLPPPSAYLPLDPFELIEDLNQGLMFPPGSGNSRKMARLLKKPRRNLGRPKILPCDVL